jgi:hypothetical protein
MCSKGDLCEVVYNEAEVETAPPEEVKLPEADEKPLVIEPQSFYPSFRKVGQFQQVAARLAGEWIT